MKDPKPADFDALNAKISVYGTLDLEKLAELYPAYHLAPPPPYGERMHIDNLLPDLEAMQAISTEIDEDPELSPEEKYVLQHELSDRWRSVVIGQSGEGFND